LAARSKDRSIAEKVRRRVLHSGEHLWGVEDFEDLENGDGSASAVNNELRRLVKRGELVRVRRGVYWRGRKSRFGMLAVPQAEAVQKSVGGEAPVGATGWHATNLLGLSTQVAPDEALAVTHRAPDGLRRAKVVSRAARHARRDARLIPVEVTFLEALEGWDRYVEADAETALARFVGLLRRGDVRVGPLVTASRTEPPAVRERLRAVLLRAGEGAAAARIKRARDERTRRRALRVLPPSV
jgi:hypothetical protein